MKFLFASCLFSCAELLVAGSVCLILCVEFQFLSDLWSVFCNSSENTCFEISHSLLQFLHEQYDLQKWKLFKWWWCRFHYNLKWTRLAGRLRFFSLSKMLNLRKLKIIISGKRSASVKYRMSCSKKLLNTFVSCLVEFSTIIYHS